MSILQQLIDYLSQPPDSIVYHIVTLLALQATLGLAWSQIRRKPDDALARRLAWASGVIFLSRLLILAVLLAFRGSDETAWLMPPLQSAVDAISVAFFVWALVPRSKRLPLLGTAILVIVIIVIAFLYVTFAGQWRTLVDSGTAQFAYDGTQQATIWIILQLGLLTIGGALVIYGRESQWSLRLAILLMSFVTQGASLLPGEIYGHLEVNITFWNRLGNLIVFPLLAILIYRHTLRSLLTSSSTGRAAVERLVQSLNHSAMVSNSLQPKKTIEAAFKMALGLLPAQIVAIVQVSDRDPKLLQIFARNPGDQQGELNGPLKLRNWSMKADDWPTFDVLLSKQEQVELLAHGPGSRRFHELCKVLSLEMKGALLVQPLRVPEKDIGLLLLGSDHTLAVWPEDEKAIAETLAVFLAQSLFNAQRQHLAPPGLARDVGRELEALKGDLSRVIGQRDEALKQAAKLSDQLSLAQERMNADGQKLHETTQALVLAAQQQDDAHDLERELAGLREALSEAQQSLARAASDETGLNTDWVMRTVTRYSGQLEEAQAKIDALEGRLSQSDVVSTLGRYAGITDQLWTPLTALEGYIDLLLAQAVRDVSPQQESLLRRMRVNVDSMASTVDSLASVGRTSSNNQAGTVLINIREALQQAVYAVNDEIQAKKVKVDIQVQDDLPLQENRGISLNELLTSALSAACIVSSPGGRLLIRAGSLPAGGNNGDRALRGDFLRVSVSDESGARSQVLYARSLAELNVSPNEQKPVELTELARLLDSASRLVSSYGGRSWLDLTGHGGSTLILVMPSSVATTRSEG
jgi:signal transduction histidine kinase